MTVLTYNIYKVFKLSCKQFSCCHRSCGNPLEIIFCITREGKSLGAVKDID